MIEIKNAKNLSEKAIQNIAKAIESGFGAKKED